MAAIGPADWTVTINGREEKVTGQYVSGNYFDLLGVRSVLGRTLRSADDSVFAQSGPAGAMGVISYGF